MTDTSNINFQLAADFINYTNRSVFLTGKAGTGKTTFLRYIKEHALKQTAVVAPTGVAAINAGGTTIHSFFQLPFTPFIPESSGFGSNSIATDRHHLLQRIKMNSDRRKVLQQLELLIIDEVSMVRCDVLDAIDIVLKHFRSRHHEPFGGVQVLLIGDMYQLPPVIKEEERSILSPYYRSPYFFDSRVIQEQPLAYIALDKVYRQRDEQFIAVLNKVRNNELDTEGLDILHQRYNPNFKPTKEDGFITLTSHNYRADAINTNELNSIPIKPHLFKALIDGDFGEKSYPADAMLELKVGAQVMFIKNDTEKIRRFFNGKIGIIEKFGEDAVFVQCKDEYEMIEVRRETWRNVRYTLNEESQKVEENEVGSFTQFPLRLAWAITIHKSQGLTFEKAVIDAGQSFAPGQVYVALSRCTTLQGMVLHSPIIPASLHSDERIIAFSASNEQAELSQEFEEDKRQYQSKIIAGLFDFSPLMRQVQAIVRTIEEHITTFNQESRPWIEEIATRISSLQSVAKKFEPELKQLLQQGIIPEESILLQERLQKAFPYFDGHLQWLLKYLNSSPVVSDSRQFALAYQEDLKDLHAMLALHAHLIVGCKEGFSMLKYQQQKNSFKLPVFSLNTYAGIKSNKRTNGPNQELYNSLRDLRDQIAIEEDMPIYLVASSNTLDEMTRYLPHDLKELKKITGFGDVKIERFGMQFIDVILLYCKEKNLASLIHEKTTTKRSDKVKSLKTDTKKESFDLYKQGKKIAEIAVQRNFAVQTIEGHLAHYVSLGEINIDELVDAKKKTLILSALDGFEGGSITPIKERLGNEVSFGEIRLVLAWKDFENSSLEE